MTEDFEKSDDFVDQIERLIAAPLEFDIFQRKIVRLIENLRVIAVRAAENHRYLADTIEDAYSQAIALQNIVGETHASVNARFKFWLHSFQAEHQGEGQKSREIADFSELLDLFAEKQASLCLLLSVFQIKAPAHLPIYPSGHQSTKQCSLFPFLLRRATRRIVSRLEKGME